MSSRATPSSALLPPQRADFSTRFAANEGIPEYNALLDVNLGKRREFLLGNRQSLTLLQRTGAIARVEEHAENPRQYVVYMNDKKQPASAKPKRRPMMSRTLDGRSLSSSTAGVKRSGSTPALRHPSRRSLDERDEDEDTSEDEESPQSDQGSAAINEKPSALPTTFNRPSLLKTLGRSASTNALSSNSFRLSFSSPFHSTSEAMQPPTQSSSPSSLIERLRRRRASQGEVSDLAKQHLASIADSASRGSTSKPRALSASSPAPTKTSGDSDRSVVEQLLASDAAYQLKLQVLNDEMRLLASEKVYFDAQIAAIRKRLRGVNAVHENDVAVAHYAAVMHARIVKAEEEYMKLVTAQQQVKTDIDTLRRELLAMRKVTRKLEEDVGDVEACNALLDDKIKALKTVRHALGNELSELERRAEIQEEEQRLKLPPEDDVVVDPQELMAAVQQQQQQQQRKASRRSSVVLTEGSPLATLQRMLSDSKAVANAASTAHNASGKPLLNFRSAYRVIQQTLGLGDDLDGFVAQFEGTEDALLSKHSLTEQLQEEVDALEREAASLAREAAMRHASMRGSQQHASAMQQALQEQIAKARERTESFLALKDVRNYEQTRLRGIMLRCLEVLHAEKMVNSSVLLSELSLPAMLEALQKRMTEVAITLKMQHHSKTTPAVEEEASGGGRGAKARGGGGAAGTRRSNLLQKRGNGGSKIVMGPREPSGAALTAILITAQPPTVEGAQVLSEAHAAEMHALHPSVIPASATPSASKRTASRKLTIARAASIRAGKHVSMLTTNGSVRRISAPTQTPNAAESEPSNRKPTRASMVWPLSKSASGRGKQGSTDSLIHADDALARVIDVTDELDE